MSIITTPTLHTYQRYYQRIGPVLQQPQTAGYLVLILTFATLTFFGYFAIKPTLATIVTLRKQIQDDHFINEKLEQKISDLIAAQESYQQLQPDLPLMYRSIPQAPHFSTLIVALENVTAQYDASISALQAQSLSLYPLEPTIKESSASARLVEFTVTLEGNYQHIVQFLEQLIHIDRLISVRSIEMRSEQGNALVRVNLLLSAYYLP